MKVDIMDPKVRGRDTLRHFVIGGGPDQEAIEWTGVSTEVEYYETVITAIMRWSTLSFDEVETTIQASPDTIENSDTPNFKPLYLQALTRMRNQHEKPSQ